MSDLNVDALRVLVLSADYSPLGIASIRRAFLLMQSEQAEMVEDSGDFIRTVSQQFPVPSIVRLKKLVKRPMRRVRLRRRTLLKRDNYTCQYCGKRSHDLTIDHVVPRSQGGKTAWENVVAACKSCNHKKADRTPEQAGMRLAHRPGVPSNSIWLDIIDIPSQRRQEWEPYLPRSR